MPEDIGGIDEALRPFGYRLRLPATSLRPALYGCLRKAVIGDGNFQHHSFGLWIGDLRRDGTRLIGTVQPELGVETIQ